MSTNEQVPPMSGLMIRLEALVPDDDQLTTPSFEIGSTLLVPSRSCELFEESTKVQGMETRPDTQNSWAVAWVWSGTRMVMQVDATLLVGGSGSGRGGGGPFGPASTTSSSSSSQVEPEEFPAQIFHSTYYISYGGARLELADDEEEGVLGRTDVGSEEEEEETDVPTVAPTTIVPTASPSEETDAPTGLMDRLQQVIIENDPPAAAALGLGAGDGGGQPTNEPTVPEGILVNVPSPTETMTASPTFLSNSDMPSDQPSMVPSVAPTPVVEANSGGDEDADTNFPPGVLINAPAPTPTGSLNGNSNYGTNYGGDIGYGNNYGTNYGGSGSNYGGSNVGSGEAESESTDGRTNDAGSTVPSLGSTFDMLLNFFNPSGPFAPPGESEEAGVEGSYGGYGNYGYGGYGGYGGQYGAYGGDNYGGYGSYGQYGYGSSRRNLRPKNDVKRSLRQNNKNPRVSVARHAQEKFWHHEQEQHQRKHHQSDQ